MKPYLQYIYFCTWIQYLFLLSVSFLQNGQQIVDEPMGEDDINQQTVSKRCL